MAHSGNSRWTPTSYMYSELVELRGDIRTREELETAYVEPYDGELTRAYESETTKRFVEYRDSLN